MKTIVFITTLCLGILLGNVIFRFGHEPCVPIAEKTPPEKTTAKKHAADSDSIFLYLIAVNKLTGIVEQKIVLQKCTYSQLRDIEKVYREKHQSNEVRTAERQQKKQRGENEALAAGATEIWGMKKALALNSKK